MGKEEKKINPPGRSEHIEILVKRRNSRKGSNARNWRVQQRRGDQRERGTQRER